MLASYSVSCHFLNLVAPQRARRSQRLQSHPGVPSFSIQRSTKQLPAGRWGATAWLSSVARWQANTSHGSSAAPAEPARVSRRERCPEPHVPVRRTPAGGPHAEGVLHVTEPRLQGSAPVRRKGLGPFRRASEFAGRLRRTWSTARLCRLGTMKRRKSRESDAARPRPPT